MNIKPTTMKTLLLLGALALSINSFGQESEPKLELTKIGLGLNFTPFNLTDYYSVDYSPSKLMITYTPIKFLRIAPEIGYMSTKDNNYKTSFLAYGAGLFFMNQKGKTNIYGGPKVEFATTKYTNGSETSKAGRLTIAPTIGAEYFLGQHFSLGGEFALKFISFKAIDSGSNPDDKITTTGASAQIRFYF